MDLPDGLPDLAGSPHDEQLRRLHQLARTVLEQYALTGAELTLLQYEDNAVYRVVDSRGGRFVLRVGAAEGATSRELLSETEWLGALRRETTLCVPEPVASTAGAMITEGSLVGAAGTRPCVLFRWIPGRAPDSGVDPQVMSKLGAFTAELHNHSSRFVPGGDFSRPRWDWIRVFEAPGGLGDTPLAAGLEARHLDVLVRLGGAIKEGLEKLGPISAGWGLIHADLYRDNILLDEERVGVIDFDDCGFGHYLYDVASLLDSFYRHLATGHDDYLSLRDAFLTAYHQGRPLPSDVDAQIKLFRAMRDMVTVNFILTSRNANVQSWGPARLRDILDQLASYLAGGRYPGT